MWGRLLGVTVERHRGAFAAMRNGMEQLSLHFALRRLTRRITRRAERALVDSVADSVAGATVHSVAVRVLMIGLLPLQHFASEPRAERAPLTDRPATRKVHSERMNERTSAPRTPRLANPPARGTSMDSLYVTTPVNTPVCRPRTADAVVAVCAVDAGLAE